MTSILSALKWLTGIPNPEWTPRVLEMGFMGKNEDLRVGSYPYSAVMGHNNEISA